MASMNRNLNLEEVNTDAFMGIPFLNHQTFVQKIIFWGSLCSCVVINLLGTFLFHLNANITAVITLLPLGAGIAFGCNYNEDLSLIRYLLLILSKPVKDYYTKPTEDIMQLNDSMNRMEEEGNERQKATAEEQRKLLIRLIVGIIVGIFVIVAIVIVIHSTKTQDIHHTVSACFNGRV